MSEAMDDLQDIGELIRTQDNRITDAPMFVVQVQVKDWGYESYYSDDYEWLNEEDPGITPTEGDLVFLEKEGESDLWRKCYYKTRWEFVMGCFTEQGCKDYLTRNGHNLGKTRIYAYGSYRNEEYRRVRKALALTL